MWWHTKISYVIQKMKMKNEFINYKWTFCHTETDLLGSPHTGGSWWWPSGEVGKYSSRWWHDWGWINPRSPRNISTSWCILQIFWLRDLIHFILFKLILKSKYGEQSLKRNISNSILFSKDGSVSDHFSFLHFSPENVLLWDLGSWYEDDGYPLIGYRL